MAAYLAAPTILGPVSACNTSVWLDNLVVLAGAQFEIVLSTNKIVAGAITHARMEIPVGPLQPGLVIRAQQSAPGFQPALTPQELAAVVAPAPSPSDIGVPVLRTHLYDCAYCAVFDGVYPGATVTVYDAHDNIMGAAHGIGGTAIVEFSHNVSQTQKPSLQPIPLRGGAPKAMQLACGSIPGPMLVLPSLEPPPIGLGGVLLDPRLGTLRGGQTSLELSELVAGAQLDVRIHRGNVTTTQTLCASGELGVLHGLTGLQLGDSVEVRQTMAPCRTHGEWATTFVRDLPPPIPKLPTTLCVTSPSVLVRGLVPDSFVEVAIGSAHTVLGWATARAYDMPLPDLVVEDAYQANAHALTARARFVDGASSDASAPAVLLGGAAFGAPSIVTPLHPCGSLVRVVGVQPNRLVGIEATDPKTSDVWWVIGTAWSTDTKVDVPVSAAFMSGSLQFRPIELGCDTAVGPTVKMPVLLAQALGAPQIRESADHTILDCASIHLSNLVPGAQVDLYREHLNLISFPLNPKYAPAPLLTRTWLGTYMTATSTLSVIRPRRLAVGDTVLAQQRICGATSPMSNPVQVTKGAPKPLQIDNVCAGATDGALIGAHSGSGVGVGTDLGVPIDHNGSVYLFFGDADCVNDVCPKPVYRIVGEPNPCVSLTSSLCPTDAPNARYHQLVVSDIGHFSPFEVPSGGFSYDGKMYVFMTKASNGIISGVLQDQPGKMGSSYLVSAGQYCDAFDVEFKVDDGLDWGNSQDGGKVRGDQMKFINVCARVVRNAEVPGLPSSTGDGLLIWGTGPYRTSELFLAWAPLTPGERVPDPSQWWYQTAPGPAPAFQKTGVSTAQPIDPMLDQQQKGGGEFSVAYIEGINRWILIHGDINILEGDAPWGPFTPVGQFFHGTVLPLGSFAQCSNLYGDYIVESLCTWDAESDVAAIHFTSSVANVNCDFYGSMLLRLGLSCG